MAPSTGFVFSLMEPLVEAGEEILTIVIVDLAAGLRIMGVMNGGNGTIKVGMRVAVELPSQPSANLLTIFTESAM